MPVVDLGIDGLTDEVEIGHGAFATVYMARREGLRDVVAVKVLHAAGDATAVERYARELEALGAVGRHHNVVSAISAGTLDDGRPYVVMQYVPGGSLGDRLTREGRLPWRDVVEIGVVLATVLGWAHDKKVIHRDVKPENVLLDTDFEEIRDQIRLADFGVAAFVDRTRTGSQLWTLAHAAPEMVLDGAEPSEKTDVYALASTLFQLLDGNAPFLRSPDEFLGPVFARIQDGAIPDLRHSGVPGPVAAAIERGLDREPDKRPESAPAFAALLRAAGEEAAAAEAAEVAAAAEVAGAKAAAERAAVPEAGPRRGRWWSRSRALVVAVGLAIAVVVVGGRTGREQAVDRTATTVSTTSESTTTSAAPTTTLPPGPVFTDDFSESRGWRTGDSATSRYGLLDGRYQIAGKLPRSTYPVAAPQPMLDLKLRVEADVFLTPSQSSGLVGLTCRQVSITSYYYGEVGVDGYWRVGRVGSTGSSSKDARSVSAYLPRLDLSKPVHMALDCASDSFSGTVRVKLFVNGVQAGSDFVDSTPLAPGPGGFILAAEADPAEALFDNFSAVRY